MQGNRTAGSSREQMIGEGDRAIDARC